MEFKHQSVLFNESIENLDIKKDGIYVDGTLGGGGHSYGICKKLGKKGRLIGIDQDESAISAAKERLQEFGNRVTIVRDNYSNIKRVLMDLGIDKVDGILLDIGVSSHQLDTPERGFSYMEDAPLDMRMDNRNSFDAAKLINEYSLEEITRVIREYGEEKFAWNIAKNIVRAREEKPILTTKELITIIDASIPVKAKIGKGHPAKKTFQALRIEVNRELDVLSDSIDDMIELLNPGGRLCIITFHSLEDRIVKNKFKVSENPCTCPPNFPQCICGKVSKGKVIGRKPVIPTDEEMLENKRSKSSKLRTFEKA